MIEKIRPELPEVIRKIGNDKVDEVIKNTTNQIEQACSPVSSETSSFKLFQLSQSPEKIAALIPQASVAEFNEHDPRDVRLYKILFSSIRRFVEQNLGLNKYALLTKIKELGKENLIIERNEQNLKYFISLVLKEIWGTQQETQRLFESLMDFKSKTGRCQWLDLAQAEWMTEAQLKETVVLYVTRLCGGILSLMAKKLAMNQGSLSTYLTTSGLSSEVRKIRESFNASEEDKFKAKELIQKKFEEAEKKSEPVQKFKPIYHSLIDDQAIVISEHEAAKIYYTYQFFRYLKELRENLKLDELKTEAEKKEAIINFLKYPYLQRRVSALLVDLEKYYSTYRNVLLENEQEIEQILGFKITPRDLSDRRPEVQRWIDDQTGKVELPGKLKILVHKDGRYVLLNTKMYYLRLSGLSKLKKKEAWLVFEQDNQGNKHALFYKYAEGSEQLGEFRYKYLIVEGGQVLAQRINGEKTAYLSKKIIG